MQEHEESGGMSVKVCGMCWMCRYTRKCRRPTLLYRVCRLIQAFCPCCQVANHQLGEDFQRSRRFV
jgi:hypothetical protein